MKNKYRIRGWIALAMALVALIVWGVTRKTGVAFPGALAPAIVGAGITLGVIWLEAGRSEKASKQFEADQKDERSLIIKGKAAVIALFSVFGLLIVVSTWLFSAESVTSAFLVFGVLLFGLAVFEIAKAVFEKKM